MDDQNHVVYCDSCKAIAIDYQEKMIEYNLYYRYWTENGELAIGEVEFIDGHPDGARQPLCGLCHEETPHYVKLERNEFLLILKSCYRNAYNKNRQIDKGFKIELKHEEEPDSVLMIAPTLQEIKEAITENNV